MRCIYCLQFVRNYHYIRGADFSLEIERTKDAEEEGSPPHPTAGSAGAE